MTARAALTGILGAYWGICFGMAIILTYMNVHQKIALILLLFSITPLIVDMYFGCKSKMKTLRW